ncbi:MAG: DUF4124 domain-containing protein, partial [Steroidobacteraceae bacterium]
MRCPACRLAALTLALLAGASGGAALAASAAPVPGTTTIYRWVDAQGVVHYTDSPQPGAQQLHVPPAQTYRAQPVQSEPGTDTSGASAASYQACLIEQPAAQQSFFAPDQVVVAVEVVPQLHDGEQLAVTMDGKPLQPADPSGVNFAISEPDRGAHSITAIVHDASGRAVCRASPVTFYVRRPSLLSPQSPARAGLGQPAPSGANPH